MIILLLVSLGCPFWAPYTVLHSQKKAVRELVSEHLREGIQDSELVLLTFSVSETKTKLRWEHEREFEYRGQMYDLVEMTTKGDSVSYLCYWDKEETRLNHKLEQLITWVLGTASEEGNSGNGLLLMKPLFYQAITPWTLCSPAWYELYTGYRFMTRSTRPVALAPLPLPPER